MSVSSDITEVIPGESIPNYIESFHYGPDLSGIVPWVEPVPDGTGPVFVFPRADELTVPAGAKVEGNAFTEVVFTTDQTLATSGVVGMTLRLSGEAQKDARGGMPRSMLDQGLKAMRRRLNSDMFATTLGATSTIGDDATAFNMAHVAAGAALFEGLSPESNAIGLVCSPVQYGTLAADWLSSNAAILSTLDRDEMLRPTPGYKGRWAGLEVFVTPHAATDTGTINGAITALGRGSGFGVAVWHGIQAVEDPEPGNYRTAWHMSARYSCVLTNPANLTELVSSAD